MLHNFSRFCFSPLFFFFYQSQSQSHVIIQVQSNCHKWFKVSIYSYFFYLFILYLYDFFFIWRSILIFFVPEWVIQIYCLANLLLLLTVGYKSIIFFSFEMLCYIMICPYSKYSIFLKWFLNHMYIYWYDLTRKCKVKENLFLCLEYLSSFPCCPYLLISPFLAQSVRDILSTTTFQFSF